MCKMFLNSSYKLMCDSNGMWQGTWPICIPAQPCSKSEITSKLPPSVIIEQIGNVHYVNETEWMAIEDSWVRYGCPSPDYVMLGKSELHCKDSKWSDKIPLCFKSKCCI